VHIKYDGRSIDWLNLVFRFSPLPLSTAGFIAAAFIEAEGSAFFPIFCPVLMIR
jgi:hypothetical protein